MATPASAQAPTHAGSDTMTITATVLPSCRVTAGEMAFGTIDPRGGGGASQALVGLDCTPGTAFSVALDDGRNGARRMADPATGALLHYEIYRDPAARLRWGAAPGETVAAVAPADGRVEISAYGRVVVDRATAGRYSDVVTVSVMF